MREPPLRSNAPSPLPPAFLRVIDQLQVLALEHPHAAEEAVMHMARLMKAIRAEGARRRVSDEGAAPMRDRDPAGSDPFHTPDHEPRPPVTPRPRERLWTLRKGDQTMDCDILDHSDYGVEVQLLRHGHWYAGRLFDLRARALAHADLTRADLERGGWHKDEQTY
jgi:hypothetical protein